MKKFEHPWSENFDEIIKEFKTDKDTGLSKDEVNNRIKKFGPNALKKKEKKRAWSIFFDQFHSVLVWLLLGAVVVSFSFGDLLEGFAILAVVLINAAIGFFTEIRATRSMEALHALTKVRSKVIREGSVDEIESEYMVPGDIALMEAGDVVTADIRLIEASKLQVDESALTGESLPVEKRPDKIDQEAPLAERHCMLYKGTALTRGSAKGVVVGTGIETELGRITKLVEEAAEEITPLEKRLESLGKNLVYIMLAIACVVAITGILRGRDIVLMIETAIALAVATVPEGLPIVATIALAKGMWRMAKRHALINKLSSVETLGSTTVIFTDKTGTLTENKMTVTKVLSFDKIFDVSGGGLDTRGGFQLDGKQVSVKEEAVLLKMLETALLCNNAASKKDGSGFVGDPMEVALLIAGIKGGLDKSELQKKFPERMEVSFDPEIKMMATFNQKNVEFLISVKGAPEQVLKTCDHFLVNGEVKPLKDEDRKKWLEKNESLAQQGQRMLGFAFKKTHEIGDPYEKLVFIGIMGLMDPPRQEVKGSIEKCKRAGIRVIMVTGDQAATASYVAGALGICDKETNPVIQGKELGDIKGLSPSKIEQIKRTSIFARVAPAQKLNLIEIYQKSGEVVAMTGDGVNDAPALKKADIGIAMGQRGTQVAQEASDMILQDDNFVSIADAVEQGRIIFNNIRSFVIYLLSCNLSELFVIFIASLINISLPILPLQILFLNMVTDVFPALALGVNNGSPDIMNAPPRKAHEAILTRSHWKGIIVYGLIITLSVLGAFALASFRFGMYVNGQGSDKVVTISFMTLAFAQLWHVFNMREKGSSFINNQITQNPYIWGALAVCTGLLLVTVYTPLSVVLKTTNPGLEGWVIILTMSLIPYIIGQIWCSIK